jgi:Cobalamin synthesis protein cobW C-terminal domain
MLKRGSGVDEQEVWWLIRAVFWSLLLFVAGTGAPPVVVHGVQHLVHPPDHLRQWLDDDRSSRIVFIVRDLSRDLIERSLAAFTRLGAPALVEA